MLLCLITTVASDKVAPCMMAMHYSVYIMHCTHQLLQPLAMGYCVTSNKVAHVGICIELSFDIRSSNINEQYSFTKAYFI